MNTLNPNISMYILHTVLHTFSVVMMRGVGGGGLKAKTFRSGEGFSKSYSFPRVSCWSNQPELRQNLGVWTFSCRHL